MRTTIEGEILIGRIIVRIYIKNYKCCEKVFVEEKSANGMCMAISNY